MNDSVLKKKKKGNPHIFPLWFIKWENKRAPKKESILLYWSSATKVIIEVYEAGFNSMKWKYQNVIVFTRILLNNTEL